jgi:hypothetical protein
MRKMEGNLVEVVSFEGEEFFGSEGEIMGDGEFLRDVADFDPGVPFNGTLVGDKTKEGAEEDAFAGAVGANDGKGFVAMELKTDVV